MQVIVNKAIEGESYVLIVPSRSAHKAPVHVIGPSGPGHRKAVKQAIFDALGEVNPDLDK